MLVTLAPKRVLPLTLKLLTCVTLPPRSALPKTVRLLPAPARVLPVMRVAPVKVLLLASVTAPV